MTFDDFFIKYHGLAKPEWMNDHRIYMKEAWEAALNKGTPAEQTGNSRYATALDVVQQYVKEVANSESSKFVDWLYQRLNPAERDSA